MSGGKIESVEVALRSPFLCTGFSSCASIATSCLFCSLSVSRSLPRSIGEFFPLSQPRFPTHFSPCFRYCGFNRFSEAAASDKIAACSHARPFCHVTHASSLAFMSRSLERDLGFVKSWKNIMSLWLPVAVQTVSQQGFIHMANRLRNRLRISLRFPLLEKVQK